MNIGKDKVMNKWNKMPSNKSHLNKIKYQNEH